MGRTKKTAKGRLDKFYHLAKDSGYRSRAAFKLVQLHKKYNFLHKCRSAVDLCAAPGSWMQVCTKYMPVGSKIVGVDLCAIKPIRGCVAFQEDITTQKCRAVLKKELSGKAVDCFLHDGAPNVGANWQKDAYNQAELTLHAVKLASEFLTPGGTFVTKVFRSQDYNNLLWVFNQLFTKVEATKPQASRNVSAEIFVYCSGYKAPKKIDPKFLDPKYVFKEISVEDKKKGTVFDKQKANARNRDGYEEGLNVLFKRVSVMRFIEAAEPIPMFSDYNEFEFDDEAKHLLKHPATNDDVLFACKDLKVLGKKDFKALLKWRLEVLASVKKDKKVEEPKKEEESEDSMDEEEKLDLELRNLTKDQLRRAKKAKKKEREKKIKQKKRFAMSGLNDINKDTVDDPTLFSVKPVKRGEQLDELVSDGQAAVYDAEAMSSESDSESDTLESGSEDEDGNRYEDVMEEYLDEMYDDYRSRQQSRKAALENAKKDGTQKKMKRAQKLAMRTEEHTKNILDDLDKSRKNKKASSDDEASESSDESDGDSDHAMLRHIEKDSKMTKSQAADLWFNQDLFDGIDDDDDDNDDDSDDGDLTGVVGLGKRPAESDSAADAKKVKVSGLAMPASKGTKRKAEDDLEDAGSEDESEDEDRKGKKKGEFDFEEVPVVMDNDENIEARAEMMALGKKLKDPKTKKELLDDSYNRYAWPDENLPSWFIDDEKNHNQKSLPLTKEEVMEMKSKFKAINAAPIKKIAEAKARKKFKMSQKMTKLNNKANTLLESQEMTEKAKAKAIEKMYKGQTQKAKPGKIYMIGGAGGGSGKFKNGKKVKVVDKRLKKDARNNPAGGRRSKKSIKRGPKPKKG